MRDLSIIIPTSNREDILRITVINALQAIEGMNAEIIIVNDGDALSGFPELPTDKIGIFDNSGSGVAAARNFGASKASANLLLFLDDDMIISKEKLLKAMDIKKQFPEAAFNFNWHYPDELLSNISETKFGRFLIHNDLTTMKGWSKDPEWKDDEPFESKGIAGATLMIRKLDYDKVNGYDPSYPFAGAEDFDFTVRLKKSGIKTMVEPGIIFYHNEMNKISLDGWCRRSERAAITRRHAVLKGYSDMALNIDPQKKTIYKVAGKLQFLLFGISNLIPNARIFDGLYSVLARLLIVIHLVRGYDGYKPAEPGN